MPFLGDSTGILCIVLWIRPEETSEKALGTDATTLAYSDPETQDRLKSCYGLGLDVLKNLIVLIGGAFER